MQKCLQNNNKINAQRIYKLFVVCIVCISACYAAVAAPPHSDIKNKLIVFNVPRQPLHKALEVFCQQSKIQFLTAVGHISYSISNSVQGKYNPEQALTLLLKDTGYYYRFSDSRTITLHADASLIADTIVQNNPDPDFELSLPPADSTPMPQTAPATPLIEEVIVSARLHQEKFVDSPIAVTKIDIQNQSERHLNDLTQTTRFTPNVDFSFGGTSSGSTSAAVMYIRGVGQNDFTPVTDPGVGVYMDGVYLGRTLGSVVEISDLKSIQILRGPQGTLFGRNTIGGAILLESSSPVYGSEDNGKLNLKGSLALGNHGRKGLSLSTNLSFSDSSGMRIAYVGRRMDGYVTRVLAGDELGDEHADTVRTKINWDFDNHNKLSFSVDATRERESSAPETLTHIYTESNAVRIHNQHIEQNNPSINCKSKSLLMYHLQTGCLTNVLADAPFTSYETGPSRNDIDNIGFSLTWDTPFNNAIDLKSISAFRYINAQFTRSSDGTPVTVIQTEDSYDQKQLSQEIHIRKKPDNNDFYWVGGIYLMLEKAANFSTIESTLSNYPIYFGGKTDNNNAAIFFEGNYKLSQKWLVSLGIRKTYENKTFLPTSIALTTQAELISHRSKTLRFDELTWRASTLYHPNEKSSIYLTLSRGFKSGGFVHRYFEPSPDGLITFDPEYVTQYELGYKAVSPQNRLRFSALGFYSDYKNIQTAANPTGRPATITDNAARGHISGLEAEILWSLIPNLKLEASIGLQEAGYDEIGSENVTIDLDDDFIRTPSTSINFGISHNYPSLFQGSLVSRLDWTLRSKIEYEPDNDDNVSEDGYQTFDLNFSYEPYDGRWGLQFGAYNLTNEEYMIAGDSNREFGYALAVFARPRHWYLSLNWNL